MRQSIIIEGFWNIGKTSFIKQWAAEKEYTIVPEPDHLRHKIKQVDDWYIAEHEKREKALFKQNDKPMIFERSTISAAAYDYASEQFSSSVEQAMREFSIKFQQFRPLLVFMYQDLSEIASRSFNIENTNIKQKMQDDKFINRYDYFYRNILPFKYDIVPLCMKQPNTYRKDNPLSNLKIVDSAIKANRLAQVNVVCFTKINQEIKFLVLKRNSQKGGFWQTVTGGVNFNHGLLQTIKKEISEELSIAITYENMIKTDYVYNFIGSEGYELNEYVFGCRVNNPNEIKISDEHTNRTFVKIADAQKLIKFETNQLALSRVLSQIK